MQISEFAAVMDVAKTFITSLGGGTQFERFVPAPDAIEIGTKKDHPHISIHYHLSQLSDYDRGVVVDALSRLEPVTWGLDTTPYGEALVVVDDMTVQVEVEVYVPGLHDRGHFLKAALLSAGWASVPGVA